MRARRAHLAASRALGVLVAITTWLLSPLARADAPVCDTTNLMERARLTRWSETSRATALLTDDAVVPEGATWTSQAVAFESRASSLSFDLGSELAIGSVYMQGDADASFVLLLSRDAKSWRRVTIDRVPGGGIRSRSSSIDPVEARYVRFGEPSSEGASATELQLRCQAPPTLALRVLERDPSPLPLPAVDGLRSRLWSKLTGVPVLTPAQALGLKLVLSLLVALALALPVRRFARARDVILVVAAVASFAGYYNWGAYRFPDYAHAHDLFHYVVGGKYVRELGYTRLYDCANAVDAEQGLRAQAESRHVRDLRDNEIEDGEASLAHADECKTAFTPARWSAFAHDVAWFRDHMSPSAWDRVLRDHGYNPSPVWAVLGSPLANLRPASRGFVGYADSITSGALTLIDPALIVIALAAVTWGFGWRTACVAAAFFGCNPLASFLWTGGAYLRQDWFAFTIIGLCFLKKERFALGGAFLAYASWLRVFPALLFFPLALRLAWTGWRERRIDRELAQVFLGATSASIALVMLSGAVTGGQHAWIDFAHNTAKLASSPSMNLVGLRTLFSFRPSTRAEVLFDASLLDPFAHVVEARRANFAHALPYFVAAVGSFLALVIRAVRRQRDAWVLACLGVALVPIVAELSCYYSSFLVGAALLLRPQPRVAVALVASCAAFLGLHLLLENDVLYACASGVVVAFAVWMAWECGAARQTSEGEAQRTTTKRGTLVAAAVALALVALVACEPRNEMMRLDAVCEARWTDLEDAFQARPDLVATLTSRPGDADAADVAAAVTAGRRAQSLRLAGEDFADGLKVAAFARTQADARAALVRALSSSTLEAADARIATAGVRYDEAAAEFNAALAHTASVAIDRATGRLFMPRVTFGAAR